MAESARDVVDVQAAGYVDPSLATPTTGQPASTSTTTAAAAVTTSAPPPTAPAPPTTAPVQVASVETVVVHRTTTTTRPPAPTTTSTTVPPPSQTGTASWYQAPPGSCAHQTLPFGTVVTITNLASGATATCTVDDRGPYLDGRILDMSPDVFAQLAPTSQGIINVRITW